MNKLAVITGPTASGKSGLGIDLAHELDVSVNAVRFHLNNLHTKTGCASRTELAIAAAGSGIAVMGIK